MGLIIFRWLQNLQFEGFLSDPFMIFIAYPDKSKGTDKTVKSLVLLDLKNNVLLIKHETSFVDYFSLTF